MEKLNELLLALKHEIEQNNTDANSFYLKLIHH